MGDDKPKLGQRPLSAAIPLALGICIVLGLSGSQWATRWILSGAPILTLCLLCGASNGYRVLGFVPLSILVVTLNLVYAIASTSWLLRGLWIATVYPTIFLTCMCQFDFVAQTVRHGLRRFLKQLHFVDDTIAFFEIPALEIDVDVEGLMVIRGMTFSLSNLSVVAHGIEVGIKLSADIELAISVETVHISFFRGIEISDCYANVKGGLEEMTFGELDETESDGEGAVIVESTPLLLAAGLRSRRPGNTRHRSIAQEKKMKDSNAKAGWSSIRKVNPADHTAREEYNRLLRRIDDTNAINTCRKQVLQELGNDGKIDSRRDIRAAICSAMQSTTTVPHPPGRSIKVTTLQTLSSPRTRGILHRLPLLLRLLLNPISYFHPVKISSITAGGSGRRISYLLKTHMFKDNANESRELRKLEKRLLRWLADANFVVELDDVKGLATVPIVTTYDIMAMLRFGDVLAYRTLISQTSLEQVVRLAGADATFSIPSYLLPHHEHLLPAKVSDEEIAHLTVNVEEADGKPNRAKATTELEQAEKDLTNVQLSAHAQLPASCSQDLLDFAATLVKASKMAEIEKDPGLEAKQSGIKEFGHALSKSMKDGVKHAVVSGVINDRWIAKMVGKLTRHLEEAQGDLGWAGDIPVELSKYRLPEGHPELEKLLP
jgi:hypothetical protein